MMINMNKKSINTRRKFIATTGMATAGVTLGAFGLKTSTYKRIPGSNDKIRIGFIGVGDRGSQLMHLFMAQSDCEVAALCDVYEPYLLRDKNIVHPRYISDMSGSIPQMGEKFPYEVKRYSDYRKLLEE